MGRKPCCNKDEVRRGAWTSEEDKLLVQYLTTHGEGKWRSLPLNAGLNRCGKSCRLRWFNYLKPDIKRGNITLEEEDLIIELHNKFGNRWALIAERLPGRTDNEIKNYWNTSLKRKILKNGSKLEISLKNKKSTGKKMADIIKPGGSPSPSSEITSSDYSSPENETSSSSNVWERLLQELELESEDKKGDPMHVASGDAVSMTPTHDYQVTMEQPYQIKLENQTHGYQVTMEQPYQIKLDNQIPNTPYELELMNSDEIWNNQADISCFSGKCDNENDWANWLESFDVGSFSSILDEDLWGSVCV